MVAAVEEGDEAGDPERDRGLQDGGVQFGVHDGVLADGDGGNDSRRETPAVATSRTSGSGRGTT